MNGCALHAMQRKYFRITLAIREKRIVLSDSITLYCIIILYYYFVLLYCIILHRILLPSAQDA